MFFRSRQGLTRHPDNFLRAGRTTRLKVTMLLTGLPGKPNAIILRGEGLPSTSRVAKVRGFPGFIFTCIRYDLQRHPPFKIAMRLTLRKGKWHQFRIRDFQPYRALTYCYTAVRPVQIKRPLTCARWGPAMKSVKMECKFYQ